MNANTCNTHSLCCWVYCVNLHKATFNSGKEAEKQNNLNNSYRYLGHCGILSTTQILLKPFPKYHCHFRK